jgi:hypothetical protein
MTRSLIRVAFVTTHQIGVFKSTGQTTAAGASTRLRALLPAEYLKNHNVIVQIISLHKSVWDGTSKLVIDADMVVASKILTDEAANAVISVQASIPVIFDFCDNYFEGGEHFELHQKLLGAASYVTVNTPEMARVLRYLKPQLAISVIPDMIELAYKHPRAPAEKKPLSLLAFGSKLTCTHLNRWLPELATYSAKQTLRLELLTLIDDEVISWHRLWQENLPVTLTLTLTLWNEYQLPHCLSRSDIVIIPSDEGPFYKTKSTNRILESTISGLPCIAYPVRSYIPYWKSLVLTDKPAPAIEFLTQDKDAVFRLVEDSQERMLIAHNREKIGKAWFSAIKFINTQSRQIEVFNKSTEIDSADTIYLTKDSDKFTYRQLLDRYKTISTFVCAKWLQCSPCDRNFSADLGGDIIFFSNRPMKFQTDLTDQLQKLAHLKLFEEILHQLVKAKILTKKQAEGVVKCNWYIPRPWETMYQIDYGREHLDLLLEAQIQIDKLIKNDIDDRIINNFLATIHSFLLIEFYEAACFYNNRTWKRT